MGDRQRDNACSREGKVFFFSFFLVFSFRISNFYLGIRIFIIIFSFLIPNFFILGLGPWPKARGYLGLRFNLCYEILGLGLIYIIFNNYVKSVNSVSTVLKFKIGTDPRSLPKPM